MDNFVSAKENGTGEHTCGVGTTSKFQDSDTASVHNCRKAAYAQARLAPQHTSRCTAGSDSTKSSTWLLKICPSWFWRWAMPGGQFEWPLISVMGCQRSQESLGKYCLWKVLQFCKFIFIQKDPWGCTVAFVSFIYSIRTMVV